VIAPPAQQDLIEQGVTVEGCHRRVVAPARVIANLDLIHGAAIKTSKSVFIYRNYWNYVLEDLGLLNDRLK
jgi:hypothetical protein